MDGRYNSTGILAWTLYGMVIGFIIYALSKAFTQEAIYISIIAGAASASATLVMYLMKESDSDRFFAGLCITALGALVACVRFFSEEKAEFTIGSMIIGILAGITLSITVVSYVLKE